MNKRLFRIIELIAVIIIVIIGVISFDKFKSLVNENHIDDYEWLKDNVELVKSGGIFVVDKDNSIIFILIIIEKLLVKRLMIS